MTNGTGAGNPRPRRRLLWWGLGGLAVALVLGGVGIWYFVFRDTSPAPVDVGSAARSVNRDRDKTSSTTAPSTFDGKWNVNTTIGSFSDFSSSFAGYRIDEQLVGIGAKTTVGRTPRVRGNLTLGGAQITAAKVVADLTALKSDDARRDGRLAEQGIQTAQFPTAKFELTEPIDLDKTPAEGVSVSARATGNLTLHGVTRKVTIPLDAKLTNGVIVVTGSLDIKLPDYKIERPTSFAVLSIEDHGAFEIQLFFSHAG